MLMTTDTRRRRSTARRAVATVELAIILPALLLIVMVCIDLGRAAYSFIALKNAARAGAGYAVMNTPQDNSWSQNVQSTTRNEMLNQTGYNANNLTFPNGAPSVTTDSGGPDATIRVVTITAQYPFRPLLSSLLGVANPINMRATVKMPMIRN